MQIGNYVQSRDARLSWQLLPGVLIYDIVTDT